MHRLSIPPLTATIKQFATQEEGAGILKGGRWNHQMPHSIHCPALDAVAPLEMELKQGSVDKYCFQETTITRVRNF